MPTWAFHVRASVLFLSLAFLASAGQGLEKHFYVGAEAGEQIDSAFVVSDVDDPGFAKDERRLAAFAGLELGRYLAFEVAYHDFGSRVCCTRILDFGFDLDFDGYSASIVGRYPLGRFELFGSVGYLWWREEGTLVTIAGPAEASADGSDRLLSAGMTLRLIRGFRLRAAVERFEIERSLRSEAQESFSLGLQYHFGDAGR